MSDDGTWIYGIREEEGLIRIPSGQIVGVIDNETYYLSGAERNEQEDITVLKDEYLMKIDDDSKQILSENTSTYLATHQSDNYNTVLNGDFKLDCYEKKTVLPPSGMEVLTYRMDYFFLGYLKSKVVELGFDQDNLYVKGLTRKMTDRKSVV